MKGFLSTACLLALLFTMSSCEGALGKLMDAMRTGWAKLQGTEADRQRKKMDELVDKIPAAGEPNKAELAAAAKLEEVPGPPMNEMEKVMVVRATTLSKYHNSRDYKPRVYDMAFIELNKQYMPLQTAESVAPKDLTKFCDPPAQFDQWKLKEKKITKLENGEDLIPYVPLAYDPAYKRLELYYANSDPNPEWHTFIIKDLSGWPEWGKTAAWYYMRKGYTGSDGKLYGIKFEGVREQSNHAWVVWLDHGEYKFKTLWDNTYLIEFGGRRIEDLALIDKIRIGD